MDKRISGAVGILMVVVFLGYYAVILASVPLWMIIVLVLGMAVVDYYRSTITNGDQGNP